MDINERIKELRIALGLSGEKFGEKLGVTKVAISNIERGNRNLTDQMFKSICREFKVNENWLRTGEGEMFKPVNKNLQILEYFNDVAELDDTSFKKKISLALAQLSDEGWQHLEKFLDELNKTDY